MNVKPVSLSWVERAAVGLAVLCLSVNAAPPVLLGRLDPFWRHSAVLGPVLETGYALVVIPDYMMRGDFPYPRKAFEREVPYADHLSVVRLLGGYRGGGADDEAGREIRGRDLAFRDEKGMIRYRMELLRPRIEPYVNAGYTNLTIVLDNVPWCFPASARDDTFGQAVPPRDTEEWRAFIVEVVRELSRIVGPQAGACLRFRIGTENNGRERFDGPHEAYLRHYATSVAAIREVLPSANVGPFNMSGARLESIETRMNVNLFDLARVARGDLRRPAVLPFGWVAFSRYYRPGDPQGLGNRLNASVAGCRAIWDEFDRRFPSYTPVSREIHEFGIAPFGETERGAFVSSEPGALGATMTFHMAAGLRAAGIQRLWHWPTYDRFRKRNGSLQYLFTGDAWIYSVLESAVGWTAHALSAADPVPRGDVEVVGLSFEGPSSALAMVSLYDRSLNPRDPEWVRFSLPGSSRFSTADIRIARFNRATAPQDRMRADLAEAGFLSDEFAGRPERLGSLAEMSGRSRDAAAFVGGQMRSYEDLWVDSMTLKPATEEDVKIERTAAGPVLAARLSAPEILVVRFDSEPVRTNPEMEIQP